MKVLKKSFEEIYLDGQWLLSIPSLPVSSNSQWKRSKSGGLYLNSKVQEFRFITSLSCKQTVHKIPKDSLLSVTIFFYTPKWITMELRPRIKDLDNMAKCTLDALVQLGIKDENIFELNLKKIWSKKEEKTLIRIVDLGSDCPYHDH